MGIFGNELLKLRQKIVSRPCHFAADFCSSSCFRFAFLSLLGMTGRISTWTN